jgi:hypothetical protein
MQTAQVSYTILHCVRAQERAAAAAAAQQAAALKALREELRRDGKRQEDALERQVPSRAPAPAAWGAEKHTRSRGCGWRGKSPSAGRQRPPRPAAARRRALLRPSAPCTARRLCTSAPVQA